MKSSFSLFGIVFYPYVLLMVAGAGTAIGLYVLFTARRHGESREENVFSVEMLIIAMAAGLPAAILADALFKWAETGVFAVRGATFYGGLLVTVPLWCILLRLKKGRVTVWERLSDIAPCIPAGHALGRIGCFFGGCCFGKPTDGPFGVTFPEGSLPYQFYGGEIAIHPTQLYEAVFLLILFGILLFVPRRTAFPFYLILYGIGRFCLEFLRADDRGTIFSLSLSPAQIISLGLLLLGGVFLCVLCIKRRKSG